MTIEQMQNQYADFFGLEPTESGVIPLIENQLGLKFPDSFIRIASFFSGGMVGGISHHAIALSGPANNITDETIRLREAVKLPPSMVAIAEPPGSLIVLLTSRNDSAPEVIWLDSIDVSRLSNIESLRKPQVWSSYAEFFAFLLDREKEERE